MVAAVAFGWLCRADVSLGAQYKPCVFHRSRVAFDQALLDGYKLCLRFQRVDSRGKNCTYTSASINGTYVCSIQTKEARLYFLSIHLLSKVDYELNAEQGVMR